MSLETVLLQAACDHANRLEAELNRVAQSWTDQVRELSDQLQVVSASLFMVTQERDAAVAQLAEIARQFKKVEPLCDTLKPEPDQASTKAPRTTTAPYPPAGRTNSAQRPPRA